MYYLAKSVLQRILDLAHWEDLKQGAFKWQDLIGAFLGAAAPFALWWFSEIYKNHKARRDNLYYLERVLVDQMNATIEARNTIKDFLDVKLSELINHIRSNTTSQYSVDQAFLPIFNARSLDERIHTIATGSGYLDNKIAEVYLKSKDMPHMIDDMRRQFEHTQQINKEIAFAKLNLPYPQQQLYLRNVTEFRKTMTVDILEKNIPTYLKILCETRVALREFQKCGLLMWRIKYDTRFKFFKSRVEYLKTREAEAVHDRMGKIFEENAERELSNIEKLYK